MSYKIPANFYPTKVYRCPYLTYLSNQIYDADIREYSQILKNCKMTEMQIYITRVENNSFMHFRKKGDVLSESLNRRYCKSCIRHYMKEMYKIYPYRVFYKRFFRVVFVLCIIVY